VRAVRRSSALGSGASQVASRLPRRPDRDTRPSEDCARRRAGATCLRCSVRGFDSDGVLRLQSVRLRLADGVKHCQVSARVRVTREFGHRSTLQVEPINGLGAIESSQDGPSPRRARAAAATDESSTRLTTASSIMDSAPFSVWPLNPIQNPARRLNQPCSRLRTLLASPAHSPRGSS
jgi:hypothetical protein